MHLKPHVAVHITHFKKQLKKLYLNIQGLPPVASHELRKEDLRQIVGKDNPTILEIGCNDGNHTLWFLEAFKSPTIYCFEPDPRAIARFRGKVGNPPNVHLFELALSANNGTIEFHQSSGQYGIHPNQKFSEGWDLSGSIRKPKNHLKAFPSVKFEKQISVPTMTLDTWCHQQKVAQIDFIWMDVQGAEVDVFRGGKQMLAQTRFLYTEYSNEELYEGQPNLRKMLDYLKDFNVLTRYTGDVLLQNKRCLQSSVVNMNLQQLWQES